MKANQPPVPSTARTAAVTKGRPEVMPMLTERLLAQFPGHTPRQREVLHEHPVDAFAAFLACEHLTTLSLAHIQRTSTMVVLKTVLERSVVAVPPG